MRAWQCIAALNASANRSRVASQALSPGPAVLSVLPKDRDGLTKQHKLLFRVAHQFHKDLRLTRPGGQSFADFGQLLLECWA